MADKFEKVWGSRDAEGYLLRREELMRELRRNKNGEDTKGT